MSTFTFTLGMLLLLNAAYLLSRWQPFERDGVRRQLIPALVSLALGLWGYWVLFFGKECS